MKKFISIVALALIALLTMLVAVACDPEQEEPKSDTDGHDFKITVLGVDGKPCTDGKIQVCAVGDGANCFSGLLTLDNNGVCYVDAGSTTSPVKVPVGLTEVEIHVKGLKQYYVHDTCVAQKDKAVVINLKEKFPEFSGTGAGEFDGDVIKTEGFDPYKFVYSPDIANMNKIMGYKVTVDENNKTMFIKVEADPEDSYNIKVVGASGTVTVLTNGESGMAKSENSATGEEPSINFAVDEDGAAYFQIAFDEEAVGKDVIIELNYVDAE